MKTVSPILVMTMTAVFCGALYAEITEKQAQSKVEVLLKPSISDSLRATLLKEVQSVDPEFCTKPLKDALKDSDRSEAALRLAATLQTPGLTKEVKKHLTGEHAGLAVTVLFGAQDKDAVDELYDLWASDKTDGDLRAKIQSGFTTTNINWVRAGFKAPNKWAKLLGKDKENSDEAYAIMKFQFAPQATSQEAFAKNWRKIRKQYETIGEEFKLKGQDLLRVADPTTTGKRVGANFKLDDTQEVVIDELNSLNSGSFEIRLRVFVPENAGQLCLNLETAEFVPTEVAFTDGEWTFGLTGQGASDRSPAFTTAKTKAGEWVTLRLKVTDSAHQGRQYEVFVNNRQLTKGMFVSLSGTLDKFSISATRGEFIVGGFELIRN